MSEKNVYLIEIDTPGNFEYFRVLDQSSITWYISVDVNGALEVSDVIPKPRAGFKGIDVTPSTTPSWLEFDDSGTPFFLFPHPSGFFTVDTSAPPLGSAWNIGATLTLKSHNPRNAMDISITAGFIEVAAGTSGGVFFRFSAGTIQNNFDNKFWDPRVAQGVSFSNTILGNRSIINGSGLPRFGDIRILNHDGEYDSALDLIQFEGSPITIFKGEENQTFAQFTTFVKAQIANIRWDREAFTLSLGDKFKATEIAFQTNLYRGNGFSDGDPPIKGQAKPVVIGTVTNANPVLLNVDKLAYQVHDGAKGALTSLSVFDRGVALANTGDITTLGLASVYDWVQGPGGVFEYFRVLDQGSVTWFVSVDENGALEVSDAIPKPSGLGFPAIDVTPITTPSWLEFDDSGTPFFLFPNSAGFLTVNTSAPALGAAWVIGPTLTLRSHSGQDAMDISIVGGFIITAAGAPISPLGQYVTDLGNGLFRLGAEPVGPVTADASRGSILPGVALFNLATDHAGFISPDDIDQTALNAVDTAKPYTIGLYFRDPIGIKVLSVMSQIMHSVTGFITFTADGKLTAGLYELPAVTTTLDRINVIDFRRRQTPEALFRVKFGWQRVFLVQEFTDLQTGGVPEARRLIVNREFRFAEDEDVAIRTRRPNAQEAIRLSVLQVEANALTEAQLQIVLLGDTDRNIYEIRAADSVGVFSVGLSIALDFSRFGLGGSNIFQILGVTENLDSGITNLIVWG